MLEQAEDQGGHPGVGRGGRHGREPQQPVQAQVVGGDLAGAAAGVARLGLELVLLPDGGRAGGGVVGALQDDLAPHPGDGPEGTVGVDQAQRVEAGVHQLAAAEQVAGRPDAEHGDQQGHGEHDRLLPAGRGGQGGRRVDRQDGAEEPAVEVRRSQHDGDQVEPGEVAADQQPGLGDDDHQGGDPGHGLGGEQAERHHQLGGVVGQHLGPVQGPRQVVEEPAERPGQGLGLVVVVEAAEVTPAAVAAELDQPGPELDPEQQPPVQPSTRVGGAVAAGPRKTARKPASSSSVSQPKP